MGFLVIFTLPASADAYDVINSRGKPGQGQLAIVGDMKTNNFGRPAQEHFEVPGIDIETVAGRKASERGIQIHFNGDSCTNDDAPCFALYFLKSYRGALDFEAMSELAFDIKILETPDQPMLLRVGGYPVRFELDIKEQLPSELSTWKTIRIDRRTIAQNSYEDFSMGFVPDTFSIGTAGKAKFVLTNVKWVP